MFVVGVVVSLCADVFAVSCGLFGVVCVVVVMAQGDRCVLRVMGVRWLESLPDIRGMCRLLAAGCWLLA
ncbi:hypothetical protein AB0C11_25485, partial [Streptomyces sp. NPDC039016]|uniref:hypothetical protein n=1 Tax=Streptomyces sp. NPDC039016 TaxID=3154330 RepID=UPI0033CEA8CC